MREDDDEETETNFEFEEDLISHVMKSNHAVHHVPAARIPCTPATPPNPTHKSTEHHQLVQDVVNMLIPFGGLKWLNLNEGVIGIASPHSVCSVSGKIEEDEPWNPPPVLSKHF